MHEFQNVLAQIFICNISSDKLKVNITPDDQIKLVRAIPSIFMHGFQNNLAHFHLNICSSKLSVNVTLEGQTIKWPLASVNIMN